MEYVTGILCALQRVSADVEKSFKCLKEEENEWEQLLVSEITQQKIQDLWSTISFQPSTLCNCIIFTYNSVRTETHSCKLLNGNIWKLHGVITS